MRYPFDEFDQLFERMSRSLGDAGVANARSVDVDVSDHGDEFVVVADLPGYEREDIDVSLSGRSLTLSAHREHDSGSDESDYVRRERHSESVRRRLTLGDAVREDDASASYRNGVLTVRLPKVAAGEDSHRIDVE